ncbi:MAG: hypothetical protein GX465_18930 [Acidobacteria bacterium]|nr:hypothetical protein [Acidobacteriota bacterium]
MPISKDQLKDILSAHPDGLTIAAIRELIKQTGETYTIDGLRSKLNRLKKKGVVVNHPIYGSVAKLWFLPEHVVVQKEKNSYLEQCLDALKAGFLENTERMTILRAHVGGKPPIGSAEAYRIALAEYDEIISNVGERYYGSPIEAAAAESL